MVVQCSLKRCGLCAQHRNAEGVVVTQGTPQWYPGNHNSTQTCIGLGLPGYQRSTLGTCNNDPFCISNVDIVLGLSGYHWGVPYR